MSMQLAFLNPNPNPLHLHYASFTRKFPVNFYLKPFNSTKFPSIQQRKTSHTLTALSDFKPYLLPQHRPITLGWLCSFISVYSISQIVSRTGNFYSNIVSISDNVKLRHDGFIICVLLVTRLVSTYLQQSLLWDAALNSVYQIRVNVFQRVLDRDLGFFESSCGVSPGDIAYRITAEAADVADTVYALLNNIVPSTLQLSAVAMQMLLISPSLSLIAAMVIPMMALATACLGERQRSISKKAHLSIANLSAYLNEVLPAILFVKASNAELWEGAKFQRLANEDLNEHLKKKKMKALTPHIIQFTYFATLSILFVGSLVVSRGSFDGPTMVSFLTSLVFLIDPIQGMGKAYNEFKQGEPSIERLFDLSKFEPKVAQKADAIHLDFVSGEVQFCDVSFRYGDDMPLVLNGMNLHIKAGETVALVGPSGGGKTTLVKLLLRLHDPSSGCIRVDNHNIENVRLENLRRHIALVSQDITLFSGTVAENIGYKDLITKIDMERVKRVAQTANAAEFIVALPEGYQTNIGPRGSVLSGGQRQRLAIARALYQDSSILILDEATSALDSRSEVLVKQAVERLMENHTVLVIAHRLETVRMAQRVFLLENGKLEEHASSSFLEGHYKTGLVV